MNWMLGAFSALALLLSGYLFMENRELRADIAAQRSASVNGDTRERERNDRDVDSDESTPSAKVAPAMEAGNAPRLPDAPAESRLDRRSRRQEMFAAMLGRLPGETEEQYKQRVMMLAQPVIDRSRARVDDMRKEVEAKAGVTKEQSEAINKLMEPAFDEFMQYTNAAIKDGQLSPYDMSVTGLLDYAGGLSPLLNQTEGKFNSVLSEEQRAIFQKSGFEWGEYMFAHAPWDKVAAPPPP